MRGLDALSPSCYNHGMKLFKIDFSDPTDAQSLVLAIIALAVNPLLALLAAFIGNL